mgnify:CR=1 FL=1
MTPKARLAFTATLLASSVLLAGCGGIQLQGKIFDAMGVSDIGAKKPDPHVDERSDLVVPPSTAALPAPGSNKVAASSVDQQLPNDPVKVAAAQAAAEQAEHDKRCTEGRTKSSPEGPGDLKCRSIFTAIMGSDVTESLETDPAAEGESTASTSIFSAPTSGEKIKVVKGEVTN